MIKNYFIATIIILFLSNCSSYHRSNETIKPHSSFNDHKEAVSQLAHWQIQGKIALLQTNKRQSANIFWQYNEPSQTQTLNLTTYLGINVLTLNSQNNKHTLEVDGQHYQTQDISALIQELTGYQLPIQALSSWLKALPYSDDDTVTLNKTSFLPQQISSYYEGQLWQITYKKYKKFSGYQLPSQLVIKQNGFTLKIIIHQWTLS